MRPRRSSARSTSSSTTRDHAAVSVLDESDATARRLVDINVHGVLHGMKEALPRLRAARRTATS